MRVEEKGAITITDKIVINLGDNYSNDKYNTVGDSDDKIVINLGDNYSNDKYNSVGDSDNCR